MSQSNPEITVPEVGQVFTATYPRHPGYKDTYRVLSLDVENDCHGTILIEMIKRVEPRAKDKLFEPGENHTVVEEMWFGPTSYTNRRIEYHD